MKLSMIEHACNLNTREVDPGGLAVQIQPCLHIKSESILGSYLKTITPTETNNKHQSERIEEIL